jgi:WD40 repeat protein
VYNAAFSHNGRRVVTCSGSAAVLWSTAGRQLTEFLGNSLYDCAFSPNDTQVITADGDGNTRIFSTELVGSPAQIERIAEQRLHIAPQASATCLPIGAVKGFAQATFNGISASGARRSAPHVRWVPLL